MLSHAFAHDGATYLVSFKFSNGQWCAALSRRGDRVVRPLPAFTEQQVGRFSEHGIRAGYIGVAEWLVKSGVWLALPHRSEGAMQRPVIPITT
jgi:hypothetical protein